MRYILLLFSLNILLFACSNPSAETTSETTPTESQLGAIDFQVTGAEIAQPAFEKGLLLLHSFEYEDAREAFLEAQALDSTFAMAYWGEAMTHNHSLWQRQEQEEAVNALKKLAPSTSERAALVATELERDFFQGVEILFGEGTKYERDLAYKNHMETLLAKYPDKHEVSAFYAISLLGASRNGRDEELYNKSAKIVQGIIKENPSHPGALHYLIHSYDDPDHAHLARDAADRYSKVAPDAAHALHMPSHIYVGLGRWNDVVNSNIASWNASVKRMQAKGLEVDARSYHALNWLQYALLQRGETERASEIMDLMVQYAKNDEDNKRARSYLLTMKGGHLVENNIWEGAIADVDINVDDLNITAKAGYAFLEGMKARHQKDKTLLKTILEDMRTARQTAESIVGDSGFAMCSSAGFAGRPPNQVDIDMAHILELELQAYLADLNGDTATAKARFEKGIALEEELSYSFGPPDVFKPVHEAYGEYLLQQKEAAKALAVFEKALEINPRRLLSLKGKQAAAKQLGKATDLEAAAQELAVSLAEKERGELL